MLERLRAWYEDAEIPVEVFKAVDARGISAPLDFDHRCARSPRFQPSPRSGRPGRGQQASFNILSKEGSEHNLSEVSDHLLTESAEQNLAKALAACRPQFEAHMADGAYTEALATLAEPASPGRCILR